MGTFGTFLARPSTTQLLRRLVRDNRTLDVQLAHEGLLDADCICGVPLRFHRLASNAQVSCEEARDRCFIGEGVTQTYERVEPALRGTQIGGGHRERAQRVDDSVVQVVVHAAESECERFGGLRESASETPREGEVRR